MYLSSFVLSYIFSMGISTSKFDHMDTCSPSHQNTIWQSSLTCKPRPTLVQVPLPDNHISHVIPGHVIIDRCSGSCHSPFLSCLPTKVENVTIDVIAIQTTYSNGEWQTLCSQVVVEKHLECAPGCLIKECTTDKQTYDPSRCSCQCRDRLAEANCLASGKKWNHETCSCHCPENAWQSCSTGFMYDSEMTCGCVRISSLAAVGRLKTLCLTVLVAGVGILIAISAYLKKKEKSRKFTNEI